MTKQRELLAEIRSHHDSTRRLILDARRWADNLQHALDMLEDNVAQFWRDSEYIFIKEDK